MCNSLKEGISNGLRHGGATAFYFELKTEETGEVDADGAELADDEADGGATHGGAARRQIKFLLSDNGTGAKQPIKAGFGLSGMRERAERFGGEAEFSCEEDGGFEISMRLPADAKGDNALKGD